MYRGMGYCDTVIKCDLKFGIELCQVSCSSCVICDTHKGPVYIVFLPPAISQLATEISHKGS